MCTTSAVSRKLRAVRAGAALAVCVVGAVAPGASGQCGLEARAQIGGASRGVDLDAPAGLAGLAASGSGLALVDVSDPSNPEVVSLTPIPYDALDVTLAGPVACMPLGTSGVAFFDIADPANAEFASVYTALQDARKAVVVGDVAFVAGRASGLEVIDIGDIHAPFRIKRLATEFRTFGLAVQGGVAYLADGAGGLRVVDVSDPSQPAELARIDEGGDAAAVAVRGSVACIADNVRGLRVYDVSVPSSPALVGGAAFGGLDLTDIVIDGATVYVSSGESVPGVHPFDISDPSNPVAYTAQGESFVRGLAAAEGLLLTSPFNRGLVMLDSGNPEQLVTLGEASSPYFCESVALIGGTVFAGGTNHVGIVSVDMTDPSRPTPLGALRGANVYGLDAVGDLLYAGVGGGFLAIDAADPAEMQVLGTLPGSGLQDVAARGAIAFVVQLDSGVHSIDVSDPGAPAALDFLAVGGAQAVAAAGDLVLCAGSGGLSVIDAGDPSDLVLLANFPTGANGLDVAAEGSVAFILSLGAGVNIVDISDPGNPQLLSTVDPGSASFGSIAAGGGVLFVAESGVNDLLAAYNVTDPADPLRLRSIEIRGTPGALAPAPIGVVAADFNYGLIIAALDCCRADFNGDGAVNTQDVLAFLNAWNSGGPGADFNGDGAVDTRDVIGFLNAWSVGC